jgi:hypothetical protein
MNDLPINISWDAHSIAHLALACAIKINLNCYLNAIVEPRIRILITFDIREEVAAATFSISSGVLAHAEDATSVLPYKPEMIDPPLNDLEKTILDLNWDLHNFVDQTTEEEIVHEGNRLLVSPVANLTSIVERAIIEVICDEQNEWY